MPTFKGIDISNWQAGLSMKKVKDDGYDFVIARASATGYGDGVSKFKDSRFEEFYKGCKDNGLAIGAYHYSCANTYQKGVDEANFMYSNCLKGKQLDMPVFIDVENGQWQTSNKAGVTDAIIGFCDTLEKLGYFVGVYANYNYFKNYIDNARINRYTRWLAVWQNNKPSVSFDYGLWQYTSKLPINGITVDGDYSYHDYPTIIKEGGFNGYKKEEPKPQPEPEPVIPALTLKAGDVITVKEVKDNIITMEKKEGN